MVFVLDFIKFLLNPKSWLLIIIVWSGAYLTATIKQRAICRAAGEASRIALEAQRMERDEAVRKKAEEESKLAIDELKKQLSEQDKVLNEFKGRVIDEFKEKVQNNEIKCENPDGSWSDDEWDWLRRIR